MSIQPRLAFLLITLVFTMQLLAHVVKYAPSSYNYRLEYGHTFKSAMGIARKWNGLPQLSKYPVEEDDDKGASLVAALAIVGAYSRTDLVPDRPTTIPNSFFYFFDLIYFCTILLIWWSSSFWVNPDYENLLAFLLLVSSSFGFVFFSAEIYVFPFFSMALLFSWAALLRKNFFWGTCLAPLFASLLFLSDIFRSSSMLFGFFFLLLVFAPRYLQLDLKAKRAGIIFLVTLFSLKFIFSPTKAHPIWQSIHAGFFEFGGWVDPAHNQAFPEWMRDRSLPPNCIYFPDWSDGIQALLLRKDFPNYTLYGEYKAEYGEFFKREVLGLLSKYPLGFGRLLCHRVWRLLVVNPWQQMLADSRLLFQEPLDSFVRSLILFPILLALYLGLNRKKFFLFLCCFLPLGLPSLLVHSGYIKYNLPFHFVILSLWLLSVFHLNEIRQDRSGHCLKT